MVDIIMVGMTAVAEVVMVATAVIMVIVDHAKLMPNILSQHRCWERIKSDNFKNTINTNSTAVTCLTLRLGSLQHSD